MGAMVPMFLFDTFLHIVKNWIFRDLKKRKKTKKGIVVFLKKESVTTKRVKLHGGSNFYYRYQVYRNVIECKQPSTAVSYV